MSAVTPCWQELRPRRRDDYLDGFGPASELEPRATIADLGAGFEADSARELPLRVPQTRVHIPVRKDTVFHFLLV